ncbi:MAG: hypothetical protein ABW072_11120 [Sedimenticola sp.]
MDLELSDDYDYILYTGSISRKGYVQLSELLETKSASDGRTKGYLIISTTGGSPDAGFRIARALGHHYPDDFKLMVPDICKSAGTLIAVGANELVISDRGELGPLDVQFQKKEELFEMSSGLDIIQSMVVLQDQVKIAFREYLLDIRLGAGLGTKIAAKLASEMATSLVSPITSQIDPLRLGEHQRALRIATAYGTRLNHKFKNTTSDQIDKLLTHYPSHSFVIDRKEASNLFSRVRGPNEEESLIEQWLRNLRDLSEMAEEQEPLVLCLRDVINNMPTKDPTGEGELNAEENAEPAAEDDNPGGQLPGEANEENQD